MVKNCYEIQRSQIYIFVNILCMLVIVASISQYLTYRSSLIDLHTTVMFSGTTANSSVIERWPCLDSVN